MNKRQAAGIQPPSGGCVLKQKIVGRDTSLHLQPPSGGCVLKLYN